LTSALAVGVGGIEQGEAEIDGAQDRPDRFVVVDGAVALGHAHAPEADG
jgi:hypothetical protein